MDNPKNDSYFLAKITKDLAFITTHMSGVSADELDSNEILLDSMLFRLIQVSENAKKLSDDYKKSKPDIPWTAISGLPNRIVHDYGHVDTSVVYSTLTHDVPALLEAFS